MIKTFLKHAPNRALIKQVFGLAMCTESFKQPANESRKEELMIKSFHRVLELSRQQNSTRSPAAASSNSTIFEPFDNNNLGMDWFDDAFVADNGLYSGFF
jgi:hypothetical protein